jgi:hypothetical protein
MIADLFASYRSGSDRCCPSKRAPCEAFVMIIRISWLRLPNTHNRAILLYHMLHGRKTSLMRSRIPFNDNLLKARATEAAISTMVYFK